MSSLRGRVLAGDVRALARAASLIENHLPGGRELMDELFPYTGHAMTVGITGPPGAGKSTLVDQLAKKLRRQGKTVGILAVDPSSPYSRGAILGDRIRMQEHHQDAGVFIRSMATRGRVGGVAQSTLDVALLLDAAGREAVLIETVGIGQDEVDIARLADVTVVVLVPGLGDDVQAIKAGVLEIADVYAINKADLPGADRLEQEIRSMQSFAPSEERDHSVPVRRVVATDGRGVDELLEAIQTVFQVKGRLSARAKTWTLRLREMLHDRLLAAVSEEDIEHYAEQLACRAITPQVAVDKLAAQVRL
jgi:LAO/AO transport system kinase